MKVRMRSRAKASYRPCERSFSSKIRRSRIFAIRLTRSHRFKKMEYTNQASVTTTATMSPRLQTLAMPRSKSRRGNGADAKKGTLYR